MHENGPKMPDLPDLLKIYVYSSHFFTELPHIVCKDPTVSQFLYSKGLIFRHYVPCLNHGIAKYPYKWVTPKNQTCPRLTHGQQIDITYWPPKYAIYNDISSVDYLCELSGAAAGLIWLKCIKSRNKLCSGKNSIYNQTF